MSSGFSAFTKKANGFVNVLITDIEIRQAQSLCKIFTELKCVPFPCKAIWDTGATNTVISERLVNELELKPITQADVHGANISERVNVYQIDLLLPNRVAVIDNLVSVARNIHGGDVLIGMDIITLGDFAVRNENGKTVFSYRIPSAANHIDYVVEANKLIDKRQRRKKRKRIKKKQ